MTKNICALCLRCAIRRNIAEWLIDIVFADIWNFLFLSANPLSQMWMRRKSQVINFSLSEWMWWNESKRRNFHFITAKLEFRESPPRTCRVAIAILSARAHTFFTILLIHSCGVLRKAKLREAKCKTWGGYQLASLSERTIQEQTFVQCLKC